MRFTRFFLAALLIPSTSAFAQDGAPVQGSRGSGSEDVEVSKVVDGINRFSIDLYKAMIDPAQNLFVSPASVSTAIGMVYRGAAGTTAEELRTTMHFFADPHGYAPANGRLLGRLNYSSDSNQLRIANALWVQRELRLRDDFISDLKQHYGAGPQRVDYRTDADAARLTINAWIETHTAGKIVDMLTPPDVTNATRSLLVNTIYWKAGWFHPFAPDLTKSASFTAIDGHKIDIPLMHVKGAFRVAQRDRVQAISLPYDGIDADMIIFLPRSARALPKFEKSLTHAALAAWIADLDKAESQETILTVPKMRLESRSKLSEPLQHLGIGDAFSNRADFSGTTAPGEWPLKINEVIHQTFLDVDEKGSEAIAVTVVDQIEVTAAKRGRPPPPLVVRADRPFLFLLRDKATGTILFMGRYVQPARTGIAG